MTMQPATDTGLATRDDAHEPYTPPPTAALTRIADLMPRTFADLERVAKFALESGLAKVESVAQAQVIIMTGIELGFTPMQALRGIYIVEGRPFLAADSMVALVYGSGLCEEWTVTVSTDECATIRAKRKGREAITRSFTKADAERARLVKDKGGHQSYPRIMLLHRCAAVVAREAFPDVILGMYVPEEQDEIVGHVVESRVIEPRTATPAAPAANARDWSAEIDACETLEALSVLGAQMKEATKTGALPASDATRLGPVFKARKAALSTPVAPAQSEPGEAA